MAHRRSGPRPWSDRRMGREEEEREEEHGGNLRWPWSEPYATVLAQPNSHGFMVSVTMLVWFDEVPIAWP